MRKLLKFFAWWSKIISEHFWFHRFLKTFMGDPQNDSRTRKKVSKILFPKILTKWSDFLLVNTKLCPKRPRNIIVSFLADLHSLGTKKQKNKYFLRNFHYALQKNKLLVQMSSIAHSKGFSHTFWFLNSQSVKNNRETYLSNLLNK